MEQTSLKDRLAHALHSLGISANLLTFFGLLLAALSGGLIFRGELFWGAASLLISGLVDLMDGAVARVSQKASVFGGILDSSLDRYGDAFVFSGLSFYFFERGRADLAALSLSAWAGAFLVSYVRARAEREIEACRVGFWERGERIGVLVVGLAAANPAAAAWVLGVCTHWTVFQRLRSAQAGTGKPLVRSGVSYGVKIALLAAFLVFVRIP